MFGRDSGPKSGPDENTRDIVIPSVDLLRDLHEILTVDLVLWVQLVLAKAVYAEFNFKRLALLLLILRSPCLIVYQCSPRTE